MGLGDGGRRCVPDRTAVDESEGGRMLPKSRETPNHSPNTPLVRDGNSVMRPRSFGKVVDEPAARGRAARLSPSEHCSARLHDSTHRFHSPPLPHRPVPTRSYERAKHYVPATAVIVKGQRSPMHCILSSSLVLTPQPRKSLLAQVCSEPVRTRSARQRNFSKILYVNCRWT